MVIRQKMLLLCPMHMQYFSSFLVLVVNFILLCTIIYYTQMIGINRYEVTEAEISK